MRVLKNEILNKLPIILIAADRGWCWGHCQVPAAIQRRLSSSAPGHLTRSRIVSVLCDKTLFTAYVVRRFVEEWVCVGLGGEMLAP